MTTFFQNKRNFLKFSTGAVAFFALFLAESGNAACPPTLDNKVVRQLALSDDPGIQDGKKVTLNEGSDEKNMDKRMALFSSTIGLV